MTNLEIDKAMRRAIELSIEKMQGGCGGPFGAVILKDGAIIAEGWNQVTSTNDPTAHAEVVAIRNACKALNTFDLKGCELITSCEPCPMCLASAMWARIDHVVFANTRHDAADIGFDDEFFYKELALDMRDRSMPLTPHMRGEAIKAFDLWKEKTDKVRY